MSGGSIRRQDAGFDFFVDGVELGALVGAEDGADFGAGGFELFVDVGLDFLAEDQEALLAFGEDEFKVGGLSGVEIEAAL